jgi:hypothetical protein
MSLTHGALAAAERSAADTAKADADRAAIVAKVGWSFYLQWSDSIQSAPHH